MKQHQLWWGLLCLLLSSVPTAMWGCDGGCPTLGNYQNGLFPNFQKNFIGLFGRYSSLGALNGHDGLTGEHTRDYYYNLGIQTRIYPHPRLQLLAYIPYKINIQETEDKTPTRLIGLSDVSVLAFYQVYNNTLKDSLAKTQHNLMLGGGVQAPTGNHRAVDADGVALPVAFQLGTGAWNFILSGAYTIRQKKWGLNWSSTYQINLANPEGYKMGNQWSNSLVGFGILKAKDWTFAPQGGLQLEHLARNTNRGYDRIYSGGTQLLATASLQCYYKNFQIGVEYQQPIWQQMASGQIHNEARLMAQFNYLF
ncbi:MAG: hypothetical protein ACRBFS_11835 [Aureispira sp.]